ncbi:hypothetical protein [Streptomyces sp. WAC 04229]|uniref:hypothetical protein n=1 Tax=Streptomyces sp. WAC 04229 TaxID=2203206 RepID=UPI00163C6A49|nr:hypothetical protein [Streptomyces sp. WAC 04229]
MPLPDFPLRTGPRRRRRLVAAASVLALSALLVTLVPVLTARGTVRSLPAERVLTVASWNMCGVFYRERDQEFAADRSGRPTHESGHKLDCLFTGLPRSGCTVRDTGVSDHRALLVRVDTG